MAASQLEFQRILAGGGIKMAEQEDADFTYPHNQGTYLALVGGLGHLKGWEEPLHNWVGSGGRWKRGRNSGGRTGPAPLRSSWARGGVPTIKGIFIFPNAFLFFLILCYCSVPFLFVAFLFPCTVCGALVPRSWGQA